VVLTRTRGKVGGDVLETYLRFSYLSLLDMLRSTTLLLLILGVLGSLAAANMSGSLFGLTARQQFFPAALVLGLTLRRVVTRRDKAVRVQTQYPAQGHEAPTPKRGNAVSQLLQKNDALLPEEAREWLDKFLIEQQ
jgi:hypothetical protein